MSKQSFIKKRHKSFAALIIIVTLLFPMVILWEGCSKDNTKGKKLVITYDLLKTKITVRFIDAVTHQIIGKEGDKQITLTVTGEDKDALMDISGLRKERYLSQNGYLVLAVDPAEAFVPTPENPLRFTLKATVDGYIPAEKTMVITGDGAFQNEIMMMDTENLPAGTASNVTTGLGNIIDDTLRSNVLAFTPGIEVKLIIPEGTVIRDATNYPLKSPLTVSLKYFSNLSDDALSAFPGGSFTSVYRNGSVTDGMLFSAGYLFFDITGSMGRHAAYFDNKPATIEMLVDGNTYNPENHGKISDGDFISVHYFEPDSGLWYFQTTDTILPYDQIPPVGEHYVSAAVTRAAWYNIGWFWNNICRNPANFVFEFDSSVCNGSIVNGTLRRQADSSFIKKISLFATLDDTVSLNHIPAGEPLFIRWDNTGSCPHATVKSDANPLFLNDICSSEIHTIPLASSENYAETALVDMKAHCPSNPDVEIRPSYGIWYRSTDNFCWQWSEMTDGYATVCGLTVGNTYIFGTFYDSQWQEWEIIPDGSGYISIDFDLPGNICNNVFGM